jgi:chromosome partitioning protein
MTTTFCFINQKGGCGKSSCCFHLAGFVAEAGLNVLLVDADPQGSLSQGFFGSSAIEGLRPEETLAALFGDTPGWPSLDALFVPTSFENISLIPANQNLALHNMPSPELAGLKQQVLRSFLGETHRFDVVFIDCPPNLYLCSWNAMLAADFVVVPVPPEDFGTQGLRLVHQAVENARHLNANLQLLGYVVTRYDGRLLVHQAYERRLRSRYGDLVLETVIPEASAFKVALTCRQPVGFCRPRSKAAKSIGRLGEEILHRALQTTAEREVA